MRKIAGIELSLLTTSRPGLLSTSYHRLEQVCFGLAKILSVQNSELINPP